MFSIRHANLFVAMSTENGIIKVVRIEAGTVEENGKAMHTFVFEDEENGTATPRWIKTKRNRIWQVLPCYCGKKNCNFVVEKARMCV